MNMFRAVPEPVKIGESAGYSATDPVPLSVLGLRWGSGWGLAQLFGSPRHADNSWQFGPWQCEP